MDIWAYWHRELCKIKDSGKNLIVTGMKLSGSVVQGALKDE